MTVVPSIVCCAARLGPPRLIPSSMSWRLLVRLRDLYFARAQCGRRDRYRPISSVRLAVLRTIASVVQAPRVGRYALATVRDLIDLDEMEPQLYKGCGSRGLR